nr:beta-galactosidase trimerization domain-containing protein [Armatimonadota bacterium]
AEDALLGVFQGIVRKYAKDPNIVGWLEPHGETGETPQKFFLDSGPYADEVMREFLRRRYGTLRAVSERWHGDANFYKTWADVHLPEIAEFAGFGPGAIDLRGTWRVKYVPAPDGHTYDQGEARGLPSPPPTAPVPPQWSMPGFDDSGWDELTAPGNDRMLYMSRSPLIYRRTVNVPADWLAANPQVTLTIWDMVNRDMDKTVVTVNGHPVVEVSHRANDQHWSEFNVTAALQAGANLLVLQMPRAIICYRAYLTGVPPRQYPRLGPQKNAQWADFVDFIIETRSAQIRRGAEMIRQVDPNSSINFMAAEDYADGVAKAAQDYGGRFHDTGAMAGFWTDSNTLRMCGAGLPVTAEPGNGAPNIREFQMFWGRWLTEGVTGVHYFQNWGEIAWNPDVLKVFQANRAMYTAVGKYHVPFAKVAVLFNLQSNWLTDFPWSQEPNSQGGYYTGFNAAAPLLNYCPRDTIGAIDFETSNADKYRVIIDGNSSITSEELIGNIEKFVRRGGVFITYGQTGRHTPSHVDSWPISKLTGFDVVHDWGWGDGKSVSVAPGQTTLTPADLPGQTRTAGLSLKPTAPDAKVLAAWDDGSTAIGMRPLGAGWMVHVGPYMGGDPFVGVYGALLRHFGMTDRVPARATPRPGLHLRHFIGNTGLHDVWILFNESDAATTTDLTFLPGFHPASLTDIVTGDKLDVTRDPAGDAVRGIALDRWQSHMYLSPRAGVASSPPEWLALQSGWWQGTVKPSAKHLPTPAEQQKFSLDLTEGWAFKMSPANSSTARPARFWMARHGRMAGR